MDYNNQNEYSWMESPKQTNRNKKNEWRCPVSVVLLLLCVTFVATMMFTFTITSRWVKQQDSAIIKEQQETIDFLREKTITADGILKQ